MVNHKAIIEEVDQAMEIDLDNVDLSIPPEIELILVARHRQAVRNTAVALRMQIKLARLRGAKDEVKPLGIRLDACIKDLAQIDRIYPSALELMKSFERADAVQELGVA